MASITAPADKRFLRAHVRPVRRQRRWRPAIRVAGRVGVGGLLLLAAFRVAAMMANAHMLTIDQITVRGTERLSTPEAMSLLRDLRGQNILRANLDVARQRLLESPWVGDAVLRKRLPSSIDVAIVERRAIGVGRLGAKLFLIDDRGGVIDGYGPKYADLDLPVVDGLMPPGARRVDESRARLAGRLMAALAVRPEVARRVSQIDVSDGSDAVVLLDTDDARLRLGDRDFLARLEAYFDLAPHVRERVASIDYVDLRYGNRVFVGTSGADKPGGTGRPGRQN
jgi:cell division protein FtsQ